MSANRSKGANFGPRGGIKCGLKPIREAKKMRPKTAILVTHEVESLSSTC